MKIVCDYCDSLVEVDENTICPNCGAALGEALKAEFLRLEAKRKEEEERLAQLEKERKKQQDDDELFEFIKTLAFGSAGAAIGGNIGRKIVTEIIRDTKKKNRK